MEKGVGIIGRNAFFLGVKNNKTRGREDSSLSHELVSIICTRSSATTMTGNVCVNR